MATTRSSTSGSGDAKDTKSDTKSTKRPSDLEIKPPTTTKKQKQSPQSDAETVSSDGKGARSLATTSQLTPEMQANLARLREGESYAAVPTTSVKPHVESDSQSGGVPAPEIIGPLNVGLDTRSPEPTPSQKEDSSSAQGNTPPSEPDNLAGDTNKSSSDKDASTEETRREFKAPKISVLARVVESGLLYVKGSNREVHLPKCRLKDHLGNAPEFAERILNISSYGVGNNIAPIFAAEPRDFYNVVNTGGFKNRHIFAGSRGHKVPDATFFIIGRVMESNLREPLDDEITVRQVCIQPIERMLPRIVSVTSRLTGYKKPFFEVKGDGIAFVTKRKSKYENANKGGGEEEEEAVMDGVTHGPVLRSYEEQVPVFDGTSAFKLVFYNQLPHRDSELDRGDFVLVAYTLSGWMSQSIQRVICNIQFAILLREYDANDKACTQANLDSRPDLFEEAYIGVDSLTALPEYDPAGKVAKAAVPKGRIMTDGPCM